MTVTRTGAIGAGGSVVSVEDDDDAIVKHLLA